MSNDFHVMLIAVIASQAGIAALLIVTATLEPGRAGRGARDRTARQVPVHRDAARPGPAGARRH